MQNVFICLAWDALVRDTAMLNNNANMRKILNSILLFALFSSALLIFYFINRGLDFSDESFYLYYAIKFNDMSVSITPFGYVIHPIFLTIGSSIVAFRLIGCISLLISGAILGHSISIHYRDLGSGLLGSRMTAVTALCNLAYYSFWTLSPGYNLLILIAVELLIAGVLVASIQKRAYALLGGIAIGAGAYLSFFAKPTVAVLCAVLMLPICWHWLRRYGWQLVAIRIATAAGTASALFAITLLPDGRAAKLIAETRGGLTYLKLGNSPAELLLKTGSDLYRSSPFFWIIAAVLISILALGATSSSIRHFKRLAIATLAIAVVFLAMNIASAFLQKESPFSFIFLPTISMAIGIVVFLYADNPAALAVDKRKLVLPAGLMIAPCMMAFGSSIPIFVQSGMYVSLVLIGAVIWIRMVGRGKTGMIAEIAILVSVPGIIMWSMLFPFHQPNAIFSDKVAVKIGPANDRLLVSAQTAAAIDTITATGRRHGMNGRNPVVDLTGMGPGVTLLLNGRAPFYPWIITSIGQPQPLADQMWSKTTVEERNISWIITPIDPTLINSAAARYFTQHKSEYQLINRATIPLRPSLSREIEIWRPIRSSKT